MFVSNLLTETMICEESPMDDSDGVASGGVRLRGKENFCPGAILE